MKVIRGRVAVTNAAGTTEVPEGATLYVRTASTPATFGNGTEPPAPRPQPQLRPQGAGRPSGSGNGGGGSATGGGIREYFGGPDRLLERAPTLY